MCECDLGLADKKKTKNFPFSKRKFTKTKKQAKFNEIFSNQAKKKDLYSFVLFSRSDGAPFSEGEGAPSPSGSSLNFKHLS